MTQKSMMICLLRPNRVYRPNRHELACSTPTVGKLGRNPFAKFCPTSR